MSPQMLGVLLLVSSAVGMAVERLAADAPRCDFPQRRIAVDGNPADWDHVVPNRVEGREHLWYGQGMTPEKWQDNGDLSYQWRGAWSGNKLYFLFEVTDESRARARTRPSSYLCDCIEIYLDCATSRRTTCRRARRACRLVHEMRSAENSEVSSCISCRLNRRESIWTMPANMPSINRRPSVFGAQWNGEVVTKRTAQRLPRGNRFYGSRPGAATGPGAGSGNGCLRRRWPGTREHPDVDWHEDRFLAFDGRIRQGDAVRPGCAQSEGPADTKPFGTLDSGAVVSAIKTPDDRWGLRVSGARTASVTQPAPVCIELSDRADEPVQSGYDSVSIVDREAVGRARGYGRSPSARRCGGPLERRRHRAARHADSARHRERACWVCVRRDAADRRALSWPQVQLVRAGNDLRWFRSSDGHRHRRQEPLPARRFHRADSRGPLAGTAAGRVFSATARRWPSSIRLRGATRSPPMPTT